MPTMDTYPAQTTPNNSDYHLVNDGVSGETKQITREDYLSGSPLPTDTVTTAAILNANVTTGKLADGAVTSAKVATGMPVQVVSTGFSSAATGTTVTPFDNTIPQNTEGDQFMTQAITPKSATNILVVEVVAMAASTAANHVIVALFQDTTAGALAAISTLAQNSNSPMTVPLSHTMVAGTTSATTFKVRIGGSNASTFTFNGLSGAAVYGAIPKSFIKITEYKAS